MHIRYCLLFLFIFSFCNIFAQEDPKFTFFQWSKPIYNPAALGEKENHLNFIGILRQQSMGMKMEDINYAPTNNDTGNNNNGKNKKKNEGWDKINGQQVFLNIDTYIKKIKGAIGVSFLKDLNTTTLGSDNIGFKLGYATRLKVRGGKLGIGVQFGFLNMKPASDKWILFNEGDPTVAKAKENDSYMDFDMNFGLLYTAPTWYVGLSGTQLLGGVRISGEKDFYKPRQAIYAIGGYIWNLNTAIPWSIEPHLLIQSNFATWRMGVIALARYNGVLWFGLGYQNNGIPVLFGATPFYNNPSEYLKGLEIGLAYTFDTKKFGYKAAGSFGDFELVLRYGFNFYKEKALTGYGSTRHLYKNQY